MGEHIILRLAARCGMEKEDVATPRIVAIRDVVYVEPNNIDAERCYMFLRNQPELPEGETEGEFLCDHSLEEIAKLLRCSTNHMDNDFGPRSVLESEEEASPPSGPVPSV